MANEFFLMDSSESLEEGRGTPGISSKVINNSFINAQRDFAKETETGKRSNGAELEVGLPGSFQFVDFFFASFYGDSHSSTDLMELLEAECLFLGFSNISLNRQIPEIRSAEMRKNISDREFSRKASGTLRSRFRKRHLLLV